ncbi:TetR family transcriptional regulator [Microbacterium sp.]|uniref:TetR family transcriptional regulator n=1 Tax=Microbacterium sp. TaxID=51671 RepID=UPI0037CC2F03
MTDTTMTPPAVRGRERTRALLLEAASEVFAEVGLDAASVEAICERAGFTRGAFYSNFESKEELMLALTTQIAEQKMALVTQRARELQEAGVQLAPSELVERMLDVAIDRRAGILLTSEIRTRALRDPRLAETYLAWQAGIVERIGVVVAELGRVYGLKPRIPEPEFARVIMQTWEDTAATAHMEGLDFAAMCALVNERTGRLAAALIDPA